MGGGKGSSGGSAIPRELREISQQYWQQTQPLRSNQGGTGGFDILSQMLAGQQPTQLPIFTPARETINAQFGRAEDALLAGGVRGGQLNQQRYDLGVERAKALGGIDASAAQQALSSALNVGMGAPTAATGPLASAGNIMAMQGATQAQEKAGLGSGLGSLAGLAAAATIGRK